MGTSKTHGVVGLCDNGGPSWAQEGTRFGPAGLVVGCHHALALWPWWLIPHPVIALRLLCLLQMLDVTVSQLLSLQPSLAARVNPKHREVKESWAQLQQALR